ncbi:hypothetical protein IMZ31_19220 (plasmid) [Pontibacillus sp. ALD_SL1]|uniref:hypothetical protein n=1 Tax=Pontibacillus sp. ALD_SL1 TaxID=2777185 RepID=UPI001A960390|nr:hypothetical protein [Pontibacillus sp. ALD_SL1]QST02682.1 hypothetical protein IMZ31_19220 [Pontibacillus sp. ALD_SL1]
MSSKKVYLIYTLVNLCAIPLYIAELFGMFMGVINEDSGSLGYVFDVLLYMGFVNLPNFALFFVLPRLSSSDIRYHNRIALICFSALVLTPYFYLSFIVIL